MDQELRTCENCKTDFEIIPEDFGFYKMLEVPPPTFCPLCSMQRRMAWRNERSLYKRKDADGKDVISIFAPDFPGTVYDMKTWWSDSWDPLAYGQPYDFSRPFFRQFKELLHRVPLAPLFNKNAVESDYCNHCEDMKKSYLAFGSIWCENIFYSKGAIHGMDSMDMLFGDKNELTYETINSEGCYNVFFAKDCTSCNNSAFLRSCHGCSHCFGCVNLRNKSYYIFNEPYSKEDYEKKIKEFDLSTFSGLEKIKNRFAAFGMSLPNKFANLVNSPGSTGDGLYDCKKCLWCFDITNNVENCKYLSNGGYHLKDSYHGYGVGMGDLMYEVIDTGLGGSKIFAAVGVRSGTNIRYAYNCHGSSNIFGCIGIRNKNYCILNMQYSKEEFEDLFPRVVAQMNEVPYTDAKGREYRYGDFFPIEISPFAYNETVAQEYFPLTQKEANDAGYGWRGPEEKSYESAKKSEILPDSIDGVSDAITGEIIACAHEGKCKEQCSVAFRIISQELEFYRNMRLSLPRLCPNCRHYQRLAMRNPQYLWHRRCTCAGKSSEGGAYQNQTAHFHGSSPCLNEFETAYAPERNEIVYCEACYQAEII